MTKSVPTPPTTSITDSVNEPLGVRSAMLLIVDTTTRLFVPSVGGTALGLWLDIRLDTKPLFTILGVIIGTLAAFGLIYLQIHSVNNAKKDFLK